jgi:hypothetical protein
VRLSGLTRVGISAHCRCPGGSQSVFFVSSVILRIEDLRRGIDLAFEVPETHLAAAIAYLLGVGSEHDDFPAAIVEKFQTLVTPKGWSLCVDLLKFRLEMRARKLATPTSFSAFTDGGQ